MSDTLEKSADRLIAIAEHQAARIEVLEAALRKILITADPNEEWLFAIALAALDQDTGQ